MANLIKLSALKANYSGSLRQENIIFCTRAMLNSENSIFFGGGVVEYWID